VVGAGGKTTAVFHLARHLPAPVWVGASAHMGAWQLGLADQHVTLIGASDLSALDGPQAAITLFTGKLDPAKNRTRGVDAELLEALHHRAAALKRGLVIEADGSRRMPLKAPAAHEPPIPPFVDSVVVVAGLSALGRSLDEETVYGADRFARLSGLPPGEPLDLDAVVRVLEHAEGGLQNIPPGARRLALLNQMDALSSGQQAHARLAACRLLAAYDAVALASLAPAAMAAGPQAAPQDPVAAHIDAVFEPSAAIVLAAGASRRMGAPKLLLDWRGEPVIRATARLALDCGAQHVIVVTGSHADEVQRVLQGLPVHIVHNPAWESGQASSVVAGLNHAPGCCGAALFFLGDQPHLPPALPRALLLRHAQARPAVLAPAVGGQRANPVLFDRVTFPRLLALHGDEGGRQVMGHFPPQLLPWDDERILWDLDTPADYERMKIA